MTSPTYHAYPFDAAFSEAVILDGLIYLFGHMGDDDDGHLAQGFDAEVHQMMTNVAASMARFDRPLGALVSVKIILTNMNMRERFETLFATYFDGSPLPACTIFGAAALALEATVKIECIAKL
jgi:2-iminobutanoate/2-iminopropanoate deaminase